MNKFADKIRQFGGKSSEESSLRLKVRLSVIRCDTLLADYLFLSLSLSLSLYHGLDLKQTLLLTEIVNLPFGMFLKLKFFN